MIAQSRRPAPDNDERAPAPARSSPGSLPGLGSPAIDAGDLATCLPVDQTGVGRPLGPGCDIGAYEYGNRAPVPRCQDVNGSAAPNCTASVSVDAGSYDPEGGAVALSQTPAGPYSPGKTSVTLTATDVEGASASCTAVVTVVDDTPPVITSSVSTPMWSPGLHHDLVNVGCRPPSQTTAVRPGHCSCRSSATRTTRPPPAQPGRSSLPMRGTLLRARCASGRSASTLRTAATIRSLFPTAAKGQFYFSKSRLVGGTLFRDEVPVSGTSLDTMSKCRSSIHTRPSPASSSP